MKLKTKANTLIKNSRIFTNSTLSIPFSSIKVLIKTSKFHECLLIVEGWANREYD